MPPKIPKEGTKEWHEMRSEDPSQLVDGFAGMDISPDNTPSEIQVKIKQLEIGKKANMTEQVAAGLSGASKKVNYTYTHPTRHAVVTKAAEPVLVELKKMANNPDLLWWIAKHVEVLSRAGEKPESHKSYKTWAKDMKKEALAEYMGYDAGSDDGEDE
jgi:hypothetical protein